MIFDTHAHLNFLAFEKDWEDKIEDCRKEKIGIINVGTNFQTSKKAVEIAKKYQNGVYASVGLHPMNLETGLVKLKSNEKEGKNFETEFREEIYEKLIALNLDKVVAIGEVGLDYYWRPKTKKKKELFKQKQKEIFLKQLDLAKRFNLPVILHCRMAHGELLEILKSKFQAQELKGVIHGFVGNLAQLREYLKMNFFVGFNGIVFKKIEGVDFESLIRETPLEKILVETDCPYLSPPGYKERNDPLGVKLVIEKIAKIKNLSFEKIAQETTKNAKKLFTKIREIS